MTTLEEDELLVGHRHPVKGGEINANCEQIGGIDQRVDTPDRLHRGHAGGKSAVAPTGYVS